MGKKSKRRRAKTALRASNEAVINKNFIMTTGTCFHGMHPTSLADAKYSEDSVEYVVNDLREIEMNSGALPHKIVAMLQEFSVVDQETIASFVSFGVNAILKAPACNEYSDEWDETRHVVFVCLCMAITMEYWIRVGGKEFASVVSVKTDPKGRRKYPWFTEWNEACMNLRTKRDLVRNLTKSIPCNCLDSVKAQLKADPKKKVCQHCNRGFLDHELYACSRCEIALYCSEECVVGDWERHKPFCKSVPKQWKATKAKS